MRPQDHGRIVFVRDCDDDVRRGELRPAPDLIVTQHADVEADLVALGALEKVVAELVDGAAVYRDAETGNGAIGRESRGSRDPARPRPTRGIRSGIALMTDRTPSTSATFREVGLADGASSQRSMGSPCVGRRPRGSTNECAPTSNRSPSVTSLCYRKDLFAAAGAVFKSDFGGRNGAVRSMPQLVRIWMTDRLRDEWDVVRRIRLWEVEHRMKVLA